MGYRYFFLNFNVRCLLLGFLYPLWTQSSIMILVSNNFHPFHWPRVKKHAVKWIFFKGIPIAHCCFTHILYFGKLKKKENMKVILKYVMYNIDEILKFRKKNFACLLHQDYVIEFLQYLQHIDIYLRASFSIVGTIISKRQQIFSPKILKHLTTTFYFGWSFGSLEDDQKKVWSSLLILCNKSVKIQ